MRTRRGGNDTSAALAVFQIDVQPIGPKACQVTEIDAVAVVYAISAATGANHAGRWAEDAFGLITCFGVVAIDYDNALLALARLAETGNVDAIGTGVLLRPAVDGIKSGSRLPAVETLSDRRFAGRRKHSPTGPSQGRGVFRESVH